MIGQGIDGGSDNVARAFSEHMGAGQAVGVLLGDELDRATGVAINQGAWHILQRKYATLACIAFLDSLCLGESGRGGLWAGESHLGQVLVVERPPRVVEGIVC